ncbi:MAG: aldehyde dehydrogenase family protein [Deltaproteobacteria bacterium]|nr:MAG: aldehyde dehydrogenase family protein [Deltaproteobacteria bacterium]
MALPFPEPPASIPATPAEVAETKLARIREAAAGWAAASIQERIDLVKAVRDAVQDQLEPWAEAVGRAKGGDHGSEEWAEAVGDGPVATIRGLRLLDEVLVRLRDTGSVGLGKDRFTTRPDGRLVAKVFPNSVLDQLLFTGFSAEVWMQPGVTADNLEAHTAVEYPKATHGGRVCLVLGAGNISSIPPLDALYKLFTEKTVCIVKMNPVNEYLGPVFERAMAPLVERGVLEFVYGGLEIGDLLCKHRDVDEIHITGSDKTYDAIVWGPNPGQDERKAKGEKANETPVSAELGNISPILLVPGPWSESDILFHARNVASMIVHNASFNCAAGKLLVTPKDWDQRDAFMDALRKVLSEEAPPRKAYYPGARGRWQRFCEAYPDAERLGPEPNEQVVPWTLISGLEPEGDHLSFSMEPFCGVLSEVAIPGKSATDFLPAAVEFVNEKVWGTLCCSVIVHDRTRRDPASEQAFQEALDELRYGSIVVNHWAGLGYALSETTWGAHPGHTPEDIGSGTGHVHNAFMFSKPQKSVVYGPFMPMLKLPWFFDHRRKNQVLTRMAAMDYEPSLLKMPLLAWHSLLA